MVEKQLLGDPSSGLPVLIWYWGRRGGGANFTLRLVKLLSKRLNPELISVAITKENEYLSRFRELNVNVIEIAGAWSSRVSFSERFKRAWKHLRFAYNLRLGSFSTVIVTMNFPLAWPLVEAIRRKHTRLIYVAHDAVPHPGDYARTWQHWTQSLLIRRADFTVALSTNVADQLSRSPALRASGLAKRLRVVLIESLFDRGQIKAIQSGRALRFLFLGRLLEYKGIDILCEALGFLRDREDWMLTIAGSGPLENFCKENFGPHPRCRLELGWLTNERLTDLLDEHDVLLCPYTEASQSGVIPEAAERGLAVIVTPIEGLREQACNNSRVVVAERVDAASFALAMTQVLEEPNCPIFDSLNAKSREVLLEAERQKWISMLVLPSKVNHQ